MGKSILVMDTPQNCGECKLLYYCHKYDDIIQTDLIPDWCPLVEAPEEQMVWHEGSDSDWERGYNSCLRQIVGE